MLRNIKSSALFAGLLGSALLLGGCDKIPGLGRLNPEAQTPASAPGSAVAPLAGVPSSPPPAESVAAIQSPPSMPTAPPVVAPTGNAVSPARSEPSLEVRSHVKQAFTYISMAKNARDATIREESIDNALKEFSLAIQKDPAYAEAYSSRAVAYMQLKKFNKADEDLRRAKELSPNSASVRYNYASLHSLNGNVDLALDEIDSALAMGFSDYDALRRDSDLDNLRKHPEFRKILEKHKVFITR